MKQLLRRRIGLGAGLVAGLALAAWLHAPGQAHLLAPGPMNTGHADLACSSCHREAPGTLRQQLQAITRAWFGSGTPAELGFRPVGNAECQRCHDRPDDRHPVFRFVEPRFAEAREAVHPERCTACHREHAGARVTVADPTFCRHCHADLAVDDDPVDVAHRELVRSERWDTCLGCHDYHGNHGLTSPTHLADAIAPDAIRTYFRGGDSPYPTPIVHARTPETP